MSRLSLVAVGDISFGRDMQSVSAPKNSGLFHGIWSLLSESDLIFGNLESPLSDRGLASAAKTTVLLDGRVSETVRLRGTPEAVLALAGVGFDVLSLANNHLGDYGAEGALDTLKHLQEVGLHAVGVGHDLDHALKPLILERQGLRVAFLAFSAFSHGQDLG